MHSLTDIETNVSINYNGDWSGEAFVYFGPPDNRIQIVVDARSLLKGRPKFVGPQPDPDPLRAYAAPLMRAISMAVVFYLSQSVIGFAEQMSVDGNG